MTRDPRLDPQPGDVVHSVAWGETYLVRLRLRARDEVIYDDGDTLRLCDVEQWRALAHGADVVTVVPE